MDAKLNEVAVNIPLAPCGEIVAVSKWDRVGPELLAALEELAFRAERRGMNADEARAAIAKAKGE